MNIILRKTHNKENIDILKERDASFDVARRLHWLDLTAIVTPVVIAVLSYIPPIINKWNYIELNRDYIVGFSTVIFFGISLTLEKMIDSKLEVSNMLREVYDCKVFGFSRNSFLYDYQKYDRKIGKWKDYPDLKNGKYQMWYRQAFCENNNRNVLCSQLDNVIYTYHIYKAYKKELHYFFAILSAGLLYIVFLSFAVWKSISAFILIMLSLFNMFQTLFSILSKANLLIVKNKEIIDEVMDESKIDEIKQTLETDMSYLRMLQDVVARNRDESVFVPKRIRVKYLKEEDTNPFYIMLNKVKTIYYDTQYPASIPSSAKEIDVLSSVTGQVMATLDKIQERLLKLLLIVDEIFKSNEIEYALDGGSLIGAVRNNGSKKLRKNGGGFIFWDDDIDISVKQSDLEKIKKALNDNLPPQYELQDYDDPFYSPRLSNLRIREKSNYSYICENDSPLYEKYKSHGIFLDVYAYTPALSSRFLDAIWRLLFIHPLNRTLLKTEKNWKYGSKPAAKYEAKFLRLKRRYLKRVSWYVKHAKNKDYCCYVPNYIDNLKKAGPYIHTSDLYGEKCSAEFEGHMFPIPSKADAVLEKFYGKDNWYKSPFKTKEELQEKHKDNWFDAKNLNVTVLKHYRYMDVFNPLNS